jgi:uncharacterized membrane protein
MQDFIPNPLHPAVVHLPVALAVLLPLFTLGALWFIRRGAPAQPTWGVAVSLMAMLVASAMVAKQTGEAQEERVERVVSDKSIHTHEEAAELFVLVSAGVLAIGAAGFLAGRAGQVARIGAAIGTAVILGAGWNVGHSGGMLVYRDGAASAYVSAGGAIPNTSVSTDREERVGRRGSGDR